MYLIQQRRDASAPRLCLLEGEGAAYMSALPEMGDHTVYANIFFLPGLVAPYDESKFGR